MSNEKRILHEQYFEKIFAMMRKASNVKLEAKNKSLNSTELRLLSEIIYAKHSGKRLISTQIAKELSVTRSAISQIVNNLEERGIVKRVPDEVDRKIAYIELSDYALEEYNREKEQSLGFVSRVIERFGDEKMESLIQLVDEFYEVVEELREEN